MHYTFGTMSSKHIVNLRNNVSTKVSLLDMPLQFGIRTMIPTDESERTTHPIVYSQWVEENEKDKKEEPWSKKSKSKGHKRGNRNRSLFLQRPSL